MSETYIKFKSDFDASVSLAKNIVITGHTGPDDDAISAALSTYFYITEILKHPSVRIIMEDEAPNEYRFRNFKGYNAITFVADFTEVLKEEDLIIIVDASTIQRTTKKLINESDFQNNIIVIDHHLNAPSKNVTLYFNQGLSSSAETIYKLFYAEKDYLNIDIAKILLLGIFGDTGAFNYIGYKQRETFDIALDLMEKADVDSIDGFTSTYNQSTEEEIKVLTCYLKNMKLIEMPNWPKFHVSFLSEEEFFKYSKAAVSGGSAIYRSLFLRKILGAPWGFIARPESTGDVSVSFRSTEGSINVRQIAQSMNIGGGHNLAAGASFMKGTAQEVSSVEEAVSKIIEYVKNNLPAYV
jgi:bifunctional oligoribonuclease and PAP phosphatase NrnA